MQAIKPNSGLSYQSLDVPLHSDMDSLPHRKFKYNHIMRFNGREMNLKIGDLIEQSIAFRPMSMNGVKRDGFFEGTFIKPNASKQYFRFPLYKTVEEYLFF